MEGISDGDKDLGSDDTSVGWQEPLSKRKKGKKTKTVAVASRTRKRVPRDGVSIADKAAVRVAAINNISGMNDHSNSFAVLINTPPCYFAFYHVRHQYRRGKYRGAD